MTPPAPQPTAEPPSGAVHETPRPVPSIRIWDVPTRLFHWALALCVGYCLFTGFDESGDLEGHMKSGQVVIGLLVFRLVWGVIGATYARFTRFAASPVAAVRFLRQFRTAAHAPGHNPAGAWAVFLLLTVLAVQAGTGLFATDDILYEGPLLHLVDSDTSAQLTGWHKRNALLVAGVVGLHLLAVFAHVLLRRERIVQGMLHGNLPLAEAAASPTRWHPLALVAALAAAVGAMYAIAYVL